MHQALRRGGGGGGQWVEPYVAPRAENEDEEDLVRTLKTIRDEVGGRPRTSC